MEVMEPVRITRLLEYRPGYLHDDMDELAAQLKPKNSNFVLIHREGMQYPLFDQSIHFTQVSLTFYRFDYENLKAVKVREPQGIPLRVL